MRHDTSRGDLSTSAHPTDISLLDLRLRRRLLVGYTLGMALYALVIVFMYPEFKNTTSLNQLTRHGSTAAALFGITGSLTSPSGWLGANLYDNFPSARHAAHHCRVRSVLPCWTG